VAPTACGGLRGSKKRVSEEEEASSMSKRQKFAQISYIAPAALFSQRTLVDADADKGDAAQRPPVIPLEFQAAGKQQSPP
jgi:hypothetical protein